MRLDDARIRTMLVGAAVSYVPPETMRRTVLASARSTIRRRHRVRRFVQGTAVAAVILGAIVSTAPGAVPLARSLGERVLQAFLPRPTLPLNTSIITRNLEEAGFVVNSVTDEPFTISKTYDLPAARFKTLAGELLLVYFDSEAERERMSVSEMPPDRGKYRYLVQAPAGSTVLKSSRPLYAGAQRNLFILAETTELVTAAETAALALLPGTVQWQSEPAVERLARALDAIGMQVQAVHDSKLEGLFPFKVRAYGLKVEDRVSSVSHPLEILIFASEDERARIELKRLPSKAGWYRYKVTGGSVVEGTSPWFFVPSGEAIVVVSNADLAERLGRQLTGGGAQEGDAGGTSLREAGGD